MALPPPSYVPIAEVSAQPLVHEWDTWDPYVLLGEINEETRRTLADVSDRGKIAFAIGCAEWVSYRFLKHLGSDERPFDYIEAFWAFEMHKKIASPQEPNEKEWQGIVLAPIHMSLITVLNVYYTTENDEGESEAAFAELTPLHVLPDPSSFKKWRSDVLARLASLYVKDPTDPWGRPVPREALDPSIPIDPETESRYVKRFLETLESSRNPLIRLQAGDNSER